MLGYGQPWVQATGLMFRTVFWECTTAKAACVWANGLTFRTVFGVHHSKNNITNEDCDHSRINNTTSCSSFNIAGSV